MSATYLQKTKLQNQEDNFDDPLFSNIRESMIESHKLLNKSSKSLQYSSSDLLPSNLSSNNESKQLCVDIDKEVTKYIQRLHSCKMTSCPNDSMPIQLAKTVRKPNYLPISSQVSSDICGICLEEVYVETSDFHCTSCQAIYCNNCIRQYMEYKILEGNVSDELLICPGVGCSRALSEAWIESHVPHSVYMKYHEYRKNQRLGIRFCPVAGCAAILNEPLHTTKRKAHCTTCSTTSCMRCGGKYHPFGVCRKVDKQLKKWTQDHDVRTCPNCQVTIEKEGGCAHMRCTHCDHEFCWRCLGKWEHHKGFVCYPVAFIRSKNPRYGPCLPIRIASKTAIVGAAAVVTVVGVGAAVVVIPIAVAAHGVKKVVRKQKQKRHNARRAAFLSNLPRPTYQ